MAKRSVKASTSGINRAKQAFERRAWTQEYLASAVGLQTRQSIWKFFSGRPIERHLFIDICFQLDLDWEDIADLPRIEPIVAEPEAEVVESATELTRVLEEQQRWLEQLRLQVASLIQNQCGVVPATLDLEQPLPLSQIYTEVNLFEHLSSHRWLELADLQHPTHETLIAQGLGELTALTSRETLQSSQQQRVAISALESIKLHNKLAIFGKPGAGKTTFLQHLALRCSENRLHSPYIPVFIPLRNIEFQPLHDSSYLLEAICKQWQGLGVSLEQIELLLQQGNLLILLDGFDEVAQNHRSELHLQIQQLAATYPQSPMVMTCRLGIEDYHFRGFTLMEMADFGWPQIEMFVQKWFTSQYAGSTVLAQEKVTQFLEQLRLQHHQPIRELAGTPILLHLLCLVFTERGTFPKKRSRLYQNGLDILLSRWDNARGIQRDLVYGNLSLSDRINILSQIATTFFEQGKQFFEKNEAIPIIMDYLAALPNSSADPETLWLQSEEVLRAIVLHHGLFVEQSRDIYSFSHLTFQEYLTARKIFTGAITRSAALKTVTSIATNLFVPPLHPLQHLAARVLDIRWREVIALTIELLPNADSLLQLMQQRIDSWILDYSSLKDFFCWLDGQATAVSSLYKPAAARAFYFSLAQNCDFDLAFACDSELALDVNKELALDLELMRILHQAKTLLDAPTVQQSFALCFALDLSPRFELEPSFGQCLHKLSKQLISVIHSQEVLEDWCCQQGQNWTEQLRSVLVEYRNIGHDWQFDATQQAILQQFYQATLFLVRCYQGASQTSAPTRLNLEERLLRMSTPDRPGVVQSMTAIDQAVS